MIEKFEKIALVLDFKNCANFTIDCKNQLQFVSNL